MNIDQISTLFDQSQVMAYAVLCGALLIGATLIEIVFDFFSGRQRNWGDTGANLAIGLFKEAGSGVVAGIVAVVALYYVSLLQFWTIEMNPWSWIAGLVLADLTYYWMHRFGHENRLLWAHHSVHHSSQDYNLSVTFRLSVVEDFIEWIFLIPMVLIGFNVFQAFACLIIVVVYQNWIHTEKIGRLGWFDRWFNTPSVHRVHHGANEKYLDKNYGGILMIWDRMFGTFQPEEEKVVYGLVKNIGTNNPVTINFIEYYRIWQDMKRCRSFTDRLRILLGGTNWRPAYFETAPSRLSNSKPQQVR